MNIAEVSIIVLGLISIFIQLKIFFLIAKNKENEQKEDKKTQESITSLISQTHKK